MQKPVFVTKQEKILQEYTKSLRETEPPVITSTGKKRGRKSGKSEYSNSVLIQQIGTRIRELRTAQSMSLDEFEKQSGMHQGQVLNLELGRVNPTVGYLEKLASELNCTLEINFIPNKK